MSREQGSFDSAPEPTSHEAVKEYLDGQMRELGQRFLSNLDVYKRNVAITTGKCKYAAGCELKIETIDDYGVKSAVLAVFKDGSLAAPKRMLQYRFTPDKPGVSVRQSFRDRELGTAMNPQAAALMERSREKLTPEVLLERGLAQIAIINEAFDFAEFLSTAAMNYEGDIEL